MREHRVPGLLEVSLVAVLSFAAISLSVGAMSKEDRLIKAAKKGNLEQVLALIDDGADVLAVDKQGRSAVSFAKAKGNIEVSRQLEEAITRRFDELNNVYKCTQFLKAYGHTEFAGPVRLRLERLSFEVAESADTIAAYNRVLEKYPRSEFAEHAGRQREELHLVADEKTMSVLRSYVVGVTTIAKFKQYFGDQIAEPWESLELRVERTKNRTGRIFLMDYQRKTSGDFSEYGTDDSNVAVFGYLGLADVIVAKLEFVGGTLKKLDFSAPIPTRN